LAGVGGHLRLEAQPPIKCCISALPAKIVGPVLINGAQLLIAFSTSRDGWTDLNIKQSLILYQLYTSEAIGTKVNEDLDDALGDTQNGSR
jgi:hypothetical protein